MRKIALAMALLTSAATASATDWTLLGRSDNSVLYVAMDKLEYRGNTVVFWDKQIYGKPVTIGPYTYLYSVAKEELSCTESKFRSLTTSIYSAAGEVQSTFNTTNWFDIPPDTMMEKVATTLCRPQ
jgi:hypothetical protein